LNEPTPPADSFQQLQQRLGSMWHQIGAALTDDTRAHHTVVVVPSLTVDTDFTTSALRAYEERMLFMLFLLRDPEIHLVLATSEPVAPEIVDYYLQLIPGIVISHARKRLKLVSPEDGSPAPLSAKLLARPHLLDEIRSYVGDPMSAHLVPFTATELERDLAIALGIPMFAADPALLAFGTKTGCRRLFAEEGIRHPLGYEGLQSLDAVVDAVLKLRAERPSLLKVVVKLNEGVSGLGNLVLDLPQPGADLIAEAVLAAINAGATAKAGTAGSYIDQIGGEGAIVEEFLVAAAVESPSVQLRVTPLGDVQLLSSHDQLLGGLDGQSYMGAVFPANPDYSRLISRDAAVIGRRLAREGVLGRFAVDFIVLKNAAGEWESYAIEINLRKGGTTAPYLILQFLTDGHYDADSGVFRTAEGQPRYYVASDHVESKEYRRFNTARLFDIVSVHGLHYNHADETGVVMHMMSDVGELGRLGVTAIGRSPEDAQRIYSEFVAVLDAEAGILASTGRADAVRRR
jgi:hypothetical protein